MVMIIAITIMPGGGISENARDCPLLMEINYTCTCLLVDRQKLSSLIVHLCVQWSLIVNLFNRPSRKENHWPRSNDHCNKCLKYLSLKAQAGIPKIGQIN